MKADGQEETIQEGENLNRARQGPQGASGQQGAGKRDIAKVSGYPARQTLQIKRSESGSNH